jgi:hypothetical protein
VQFLRTYAEMDIALDTFPYNGGTTTTEALWQGVPVVCFVGDRWASRISATLVRNAGLAECVALDLDGYVKRATELAIAPGRDAQLQVMRQTMRERLGSAPVCDVCVKISVRGFSVRLPIHPGAGRCQRADRRWAASTVLSRDVACRDRLRVSSEYPKLARWDTFGRF